MVIFALNTTNYRYVTLISYILMGPQFGVHGNKNNFSTNHKDIVPIGADLLMIEYF